MSLSAVIVDDEQLAREELAYLLKNVDVEVIAQIDRCTRRETERRRSVARLRSAHREQRAAARHVAGSGKDTVDAACEFAAWHEIADRVDRHDGTRRRRAHGRRGQASVESDRGDRSLR